LCFELGRATVVVNDDQLSLAIGKRGQNVRLAARLTGWDIDILTPIEFQAGVARLDQTLKSIDGITQELVDKTVAMGLIDVRDIEEVGITPLMEELGLEEALSQMIVERCSAEAKLVTVEQEAKKAAEAAAKAAAIAAGGGAVLAGIGRRGVDGVAFANPPLPEASAVPQAGEPVALAAADETDGSNRMPGAMEAAEGGAPEVMVHKSEPLSSSDDLSPEEQAMQGMEGADNGDRKELDDEDGDTAALAEGRAQPPVSTREETA
jgi:N utilization substance protein A